MANLLQSSEQQSTTTPAFYTDYLSNLAAKGTAAGNNVDPNSVNATPLQQQAFTNVAANVGNYQPGLATAGNTVAGSAATDVQGAANPFLQAGTTTSGLSAAQPGLNAGSSSSADLVGQYMSPYTQNVVDQIRLQNQQNIAQNLSPGITSGAVGGGQFGSQRGANALALGISNANIGALGQQATALQSGYTQALQAAQAQRAAQLTAGRAAGDLQNAFNTTQVNAGQVAGNAASQQGQLLLNAGKEQGNLAEQLQKMGLTDTSALNSLGEAQRGINRERAFQPLDVLGKQASIMSGAQLPTTITKTFNGSPLSAISSLGSLYKGAITPGPNNISPLEKFIGDAGRIFDRFKSPPAGGPVDTSPPGTTRNENGDLVDINTGVILSQFDPAPPSSELNDINTITPGSDSNIG